MVVVVLYAGFHPSLILQGFEQIRLKYPVERIYIFVDSKIDRYGAVSRHNVGILERKLSYFGPIKVKVNPLSRESVFSQFYQVFLREKDKEVLVDITDMPPLMVACVTILSMSFPNSRLYVIEPDQHGEFIPDPDTPEFEQFIARKDNLKAARLHEIEKPKEGISLVDEEELRVLVELYRRNGSAESISTLIEWIEGRSLKKDDSKKVKYSRLVVEMEEKGLLVRELKGKSRTVRLTKLGEGIAEAYVKLEEGLEQRPPVRQIKEAVPVTEL
jgi:predicted transcriptional regulator